MQLFNLTIQVKCPCPPKDSALSKYAKEYGHLPTLCESKIENLTIPDIHKALEFSHNLNSINEMIVKAVQLGKCYSGGGSGGVCALIECVK